VTNISVLDTCHTSLDTHFIIGFGSGVLCMCGRLTEVFVYVNLKR